MTHDALQGKWKCVKNEKFDDYLAAHGIPWVARKIVNKGSCHVIHVKNADGTWTVDEITAFRSSNTTYTVGERYNLKHPVTEGEINGIVEIDDAGRVVGKCFSSETSDEVVESNTKELLPNGQILQIIYFKNIVCKRYFEKEWTKYWVEYQQYCVQMIL